MTEPLPETDSGAISLRALDYGRLDKLIEGKSVLAIGPGIGGAPETAEFVRTVVERYDVPMVLDADGLNAFAGCMNSFHAGANSRADASSRRDGAIDRIEHEGDPNRSAENSPRVCSQPPGLSGLERESDAHGGAERRDLGQPDREPWYGHRRHR